MLLNIILSLITLFQDPQPKREYFRLTVYHFNSPQQQKLTEDYLSGALLPALHRAGIKNIGVFKPASIDTAAYGKRLYLLMPVSSLEDFSAAEAKVWQDQQHQKDGGPYLNAPHTNPPYTRKEVIFMRAFEGMTKLEPTPLKQARENRIYELRSYEGPTEKLYRSKVAMFNEGDEIGLFKKLGFNAVFYGEVIFGSKMPNLMYMTTFQDKADRDKRWKEFFDHPQWKELLTIERYKNTVSKAEIFLLTPTAYSDY
ncbi:MAG: NIPSNAP family protein [Bacteroidetes bacterium]|nr:NIPSNAP family protein [Bacteroidota bacterium]